MKTASGIIALLAAALFFPGCANSYVTPGGPAALSAFGLDADRVDQLTDTSIRRTLDRKPLAPFPAVIAVARVQESGYWSYDAKGHGRGKYSVIAKRTVERDEDIVKLKAMPMVRDVAMLNSLVVPHSLNSDLDVRNAAASVHADLLLLYTFDTQFNIANTAMAPLSAFTLGIFPANKAEVSTTASALLMDVRSGYIYALASSDAEDDQLANAWTDDEAVDEVRQRVEREAFETLISDFQRAWTGVVNGYAVR